VYACIKVGAIIVPMKMRTGAAEWIRLMTQVKSRMHFCLEMYHGEDMGDFIRANESELGYELTNVYVDVKKHIPKGYNINELLQGEAEELPRPKVTSEDVAAILFTSGTTRGSRGVLLTHNNIISSELIFCKGLRLDCEDIIFMPAPLSHATGFHHGIISTMLYGGKIVLLDRYDARTSMEMMEQEKCTFSMGATPFVYDYLKLMDEGVKKPSALRFYICGGAPVPYELTRKAWVSHQLMVCECYGSTESVPHVFVPPEEAMELKGLWSGKVFDDIQVRIVDEQGKDVPFGEVGEEISRGPNVFVGYLGSREDTDLALDDEGWYHSGDLCYGDDKGHIKICGRKKDIIVRGGENLNINEMEANLHGCPGLEKVAIVGMKDIRLGERVCAFVVPTDPGHPLTKEEISAYLKNKKVSKWLWPERIEYIEELPYTDSGKIKRYVLKEELERRQKEEKQ
jgi:acyl-CoA synthetase